MPADKSRPIEPKSGKHYPYKVFVSSIYLDNKQAPKHEKPWIEALERGAFRVLRGGGWGGGAYSCQSATRIAFRARFSFR